MSDNYGSIFIFLKKFSIFVDEAEFKYQMRSHPDYPSMLSVSDTLTFFNINNGLLYVDSSQIIELPDNFGAFLKNDDADSSFHFIEREGDLFLYKEEAKFRKKSLEEIIKIWDGIVLLLDQEAKDKRARDNRKTISLLPYILLSAIGIISVGIANTNIFLKGFLLFPVIGTVLSISALKDLFGIESKLISNFCNISSSTSCATIVDSKKWKIFSFISFSDLSVMFFVSQVLSLVISIYAGTSIAFLENQKTLLLSVAPIILASLYFQKFIEKKWCPICLFIIATLVMEFLYLQFVTRLPFVFEFNSSLVFLVVGTTVVFIWFPLKRHLQSDKSVREELLVANRFVRKYSTFKTLLKESPRFSIPRKGFLLGNTNSQCVLTIVTNPFCGHCKAAHEVIEDIYKKFGDKLCVQILIRAKIQGDNSKDDLLYYNFYDQYFSKGTTAFNISLKDWFDNTDLNKWLMKFQTSNIDHEAAQTFYKRSLQICSDMGVFYTPAIFINGYTFPSEYDRKLLPFFIADLIDDFDLL